MPRQDDPITQQLAAARRQQILDAAATIFAAKGFARATIRDISTEAGIADGTIYNYFANKTALLLALLERLNQSDQRADQLAQSAEMRLPDFIQTYVGQRLEHLNATDLRVVQVLLSEMLINRELRELYLSHVAGPTFTLVEQYFANWAEQGEIRAADPQMTPRLFAGLLLGLLLLRLMGDSYLEQHWDELPAAFTAFVLHGLQPSTGDDHGNNQAEPG